MGWWGEGGWVGGGLGMWKGHSFDDPSQHNCMAASPLKKHVCVFILNKIAHLSEQEFQLMHTVTEPETS